jgi:hypothetical protein
VRDHEHIENLLASEPLISDLLCLAQAGAATPRLQVGTLAAAIGAGGDGGRSPGRVRARRGGGLPSRGSRAGSGGQPDFMKRAVSLLALCAALAMGGCQIDCAPCPYYAGGPGFCTAPDNSEPCKPCLVLCPGFCLGDAGIGPRSAVPCPGFCANDAGTAATPCDGG